jgi:hypothetical protein
MQKKPRKESVFEKPKPIVKDQESQTEKKFSHASKFEMAKNGIDFGCQVGVVE